MKGIVVAGWGHLVPASLVSVYGENGKVSSSDTEQVDSAVRIYAITMERNELKANGYSQRYKISITCSRIFTISVLIAEIQGFVRWYKSNMNPFLIVRGYGIS